MSDILALARAADAQLASARAAAESAREKLPQALALLRPTLTATHSVRHNRDGSTAFAGTLGYDGGGTALVLNQPLWRLPASVGVDQAEFQVLLAQRQLAQAEQELLLRAARGYFEVLQAADELAAAGAQNSATAQLLAQTRRAFEVGTVPVTDLNEAQARHDLALAQEIGARNELESKKRVLERSIAAQLPPLASLKEGANVEFLTEADLAGLVNAATRDSLAVQAARAQLEVADKEVLRRQAAHHPSIDIVGSLNSSRNADYGAFGGTNTRRASIGFELSVPLYQGGGIESRVREALADRRRASDDLAFAERQALLDAQQAQLGVQSGAALTRALGQAVSSSQTQVRSAQRGLQVGVRTRVDVLNAEQQLFVARKDFAAARYRTLLSGLQLKAAAGALSDADLHALDALLEP